MRPRTSTVLLTCFEPFGGEAENTSEAAVAALAARWAHDDIRLVTARLPVVFARVRDELARLVEGHRPDAVVVTGEAGGRSVVTPETTARNLDDARIPDNAGEQPRERVIDPGRPATTETRMDVPALLAACARAGVPARASEDAGTFVCNHAFHQVLALTDVPAGFVHVPAVRARGTAGIGAETDPDTAGAPPEVTVEQCAAALEHAVLLAAGTAPRARDRPTRVPGTA